jgi:hypothetical protein
MGHPRSIKKKQILPRDGRQDEHPLWDAQLLVGGMGEAVAEEAVIAGAAAIGALEENVVKGPFGGASSSGAVGGVAAALGTERVFLHRCDLVHLSFLMLKNNFTISSGGSGTEW